LGVCKCELGPETVNYACDAHVTSTPSIGEYDVSSTQRLYEVEADTIRYFLAWIFQPDVEHINAYQDAKCTFLTERVPFAYGTDSYGIVAGLTGYDSTTSTNQTPQVTIGGRTFTLFSVSAIAESRVWQENKDIIFALEASLIYLWLLFYVFERIILGLKPAPGIATDAVVGIYNADIFDSRPDDDNEFVDMIDVDDDDGRM
jgi:hypothetical protein